MSQLLSEKKVLRKLGIDDFRHITKDKVIRMASLLDRMDPEVAKKALEQFPLFAQTAKEMVGNYQETLRLALEKDAESVKEFYTACNVIILSLQQMLENEALTIDEKKSIIELMLEVSRMMGEKDSENKKFIWQCIATGATAVVAVVGVIGSVLGGNTQISDHSDGGL